jgi:hypothetical protein
VVHQLSVEQRLLEKPFTHPAFIPLEKRLLRYMLWRLHGLLETCYWQKNPNVVAPVVQTMVESDGRHHRMVVIGSDCLRQTKGLSVVGFFGQRRFDADDEAAAVRDGMLFDEMHKHEGLLSYSSLELTNGDYGNCVVFRDEASKNNWGHSEVHRHAVQVLSPNYYHSIRLYNGVLPDTIMGEHLLELTVVRYFDYGEMPAWQAVRLL